jgi:hypothetical protein
MGIELNNEIRASSLAKLKSRAFWVNYISTTEFQVDWQTHKIILAFTERWSLKLRDLITEKENQ